MEFFSAVKTKRPIRLCEETRRFAWESLHGKYGDDTMQTPYISMDNFPDFNFLSEYEKYDMILDRIARYAPIRICDEELISGSATLGAAIGHNVPAAYEGNIVFDSVSHITLGFDKVLSRGLNAFEKDIDERLEDKFLCQNRRDMIKSLGNVIKSMRIWHIRYLEALKETKPENYEALKRVPFEKPANFREALQSLWFTFAFTRLCGNWSGIGRIDEMLGPYLERDLQQGVLTLEKARELLAHFFIKGCEWIVSNTPRGSGDAQHYQNIVLGGVDSNGHEVTNTVTYLVLEIIEELPIGDFPITVRLGKNSPEKLFTKIAETVRHGGGVVAVYNEDLILQSLIDFGYAPEIARNFANDGCWEIQIPGHTDFSYDAFDCLQILQKDTLKLDDKNGTAHFDTYEQLYDAFYKNLKTKLEKMHEHSTAPLIEKLNTKKRPNTGTPCSVISLFTEGCLESGRSYRDCGARYIVRSPHIGGAADTGNSLYAIYKLVFEKKLISFDELMEALRADWNGYEELRQYAKNKLTYYGNDNDEADAFTVKVFNDFADIAHKLDKTSPIRFPPGVSTFGRQVAWAKERFATPFGAKAGDILSGNASPTPGTDVAGATAIIKSYCKADLKRQTNGSALDIKLYPAAAEGENGVLALVGLMKGFLNLGGFFMQTDVIDAATLRAAKENPEAFKTLSVRISGWNARFVTLDEHWQDMIIERTEQGI